MVPVPDGHPEPHIRYCVYRIASNSLSMATYEKRWLFLCLLGTKWLKNVKKWLKVVESG